jgi:hypothetical protein
MEWFIRFVSGTDRIIIRELKCELKEALTELERYQELNPGKRFEITPGEKK